jgi:hemolysin activation/secretion protein
MGSVWLPWGYQSFTISGSSSSYAMTFLAPSGASLPFTGDSRTLTGRTERVIYRGQTARLGAYADLTYRSAHNYLLGSLIDVSSRDAAIADLGLNFSEPLAGGFASVDGSVAHGFPILGAAGDASGLPDYAPHAEFTAFKLNVSWSRPLPLSDLPLRLNSTLSAQYSPQVLYGIDQFTVGGLYAVRGFDRTNLAGDDGYVWRNDLTTAQPLLKFKAGPAPIAISPYVGIDQGYAWSNVHGIAGFSPPEGSLVGAAVGTTVSTLYFNADLFYAQAIRHAASMSRESGQFYFRLNFSN